MGKLLNSILLIIILIGFSTSQTSTTDSFDTLDSSSHGTDSNHTIKTFLIETKLTQNELENLLVKAQNNSKKVDEATKEYKEAKKNKKLKMDPFQKEIEKEIKEDSLHPLDEFRVTEITEPIQENVNATVLIAKSKINLFDKLYEKNISKKFGLMVLILVIVSVFIFHNLYTKNFSKKFNKDTFYFDNKEYMLKNY